MSQLLINQYLNNLAKLKQVSGVARESVIREAFKDLLKAWGRSLNLTFIPEHEIISAAKVRSFVDGALLHDLRIPFGYWEAKDEDDNLDAEIAKKLGRGYPQTNIIFEDSRTAVLIQNKAETIRAPMDDVVRLKNLLDLFFAYERSEIADFLKAITQFKTDLPDVLKALRGRINDAYASNTAFAKAAREFLKQAKEGINPAITDADIREMLIQHILTEDIFARVFGQSDFHRDNNVAKALYALEAKFFKGDVKQQTMKVLEPYYAAIRSTAALISSHAEKQGFLKAIYENFYKVYNPKAADRLGVVYTPNEIVRFMVESADWLCEKYFGKSLIDKNVEILDPASGTGTFIVELLEHFRGQPKKLKYKYAEELHANEIAILPYYVANLNIEATYAALTGEYAEFKNLCFVDTLDNVAGLGVRAGHQHDMFGAMSEENVERIKRQNKRKISIIIGNPPYNANQQSENDNNKNRAYPHIDRRIKATYIEESVAQKTKLYDMYARFFRWASDRLPDDGIIAFVTNRSFVDSRVFDGFRKIAIREFSEIYVVDLGGDVRANPKLSGTKHNVFGIQTGIAISFLIKRKSKSHCDVFYARRPVSETAEEKLSWLNTSRIRELEFDVIAPDNKSNWLDLVENDWDHFIAVADKETKSRKSRQDRAIFQLYTLGINSGRDEWSISQQKPEIVAKIAYLISHYNSVLKSLPPKVTREKLDALVGGSIKWTYELKSLLLKKKVLTIKPDKIVPMQYRPFSAVQFYYEIDLTKRFFRLGECQPTGREQNTYIICPANGSTPRVPFSTFSSKDLPDLNFFTPDPAHTFPRYRYADDKSRIDNITNWGLKQFKSQYGGSVVITKDDIFVYVYAVLYDPIYRETYALNLKREFPRIPFYPNFYTWRDWGQTLLNLHINYENAKPFPLKRIDTPDKKSTAAPRAILRADPDAGVIILDSETQLSGVPATAWDYKLGNRSAIGWVLDQHKEKTPKDLTIREKFYTYRFADHKESVIDLLMRVTTVSIETVKITEAMRKSPRK